MSAHTKEPWWIVGDDEALGVPYVEILAGKMGAPSCKSICNVASALLDDDTFEITGETRANARLIAQAWTIPALREALENALEVMQFAYMNAPKQPKEIEQARVALKLGQDND